MQRVSCGPFSLVRDDACAKKIKPPSNCSRVITHSFSANFLSTNSKIFTMRNRK